MITVHHLGVSQSERIVWLCGELELPYILRNYTIAPVITDGDLVLPEARR
jgi:glutathione S-transferase